MSFRKLYPRFRSKPFENFFFFVLSKWSLMSQKFMVVTTRRSSFTQRRRYAFITIIADET